mmetsp:Transcript_27735/g.85073  ORF Transcript_27735/g.85073 Transcript_27735/m.85073 type:complete len:243 (-) Transcript_27735:79-807(-)
MEEHGGDVAGVALERVEAGFGGAVPDFDEEVVGPGHEVRPGRVVGDAVDTLVVSLERELRSLAADAPDLDALIQGRRRERVLRTVEGGHHDVVVVALEGADARPVAVPVPELDGLVVPAGQRERLRGVHVDVPHEVRVRFEIGHFLPRRAVVRAQPTVVGAAHELALPRDELAASHGHVADLPGLDHVRRLRVAQIDGPGVERREQPGLLGVLVDALDPVRRRRRELRDCERHCVSWLACLV